MERGREGRGGEVPFSPLFWLHPPSLLFLLPMRQPPHSLHPHLAKVKGGETLTHRELPVAWMSRPRRARPGGSHRLRRET